MFAKKPGKHIVNLMVTVNLQALPEWLRSGEQDVPLVPFSQWREHNTYTYQVTRLPTEADKDWYFHKNAGDYSHSFNAIINLSAQFAADVPIEGPSDGGSADLELRLWRGQMSIGFCQRLILVAPLDEFINLVNRGKTALPADAEPRNQVVDVPVGFDGSKASTFMGIYESIEKTSAGYSNQLVNFTVSLPDDPVRL